MQTSESIGKLAAALSKAQAMVKGAVKDSTNPHFKSKYADLAAVWDAARAALAANDLAVMQGAEAEGNIVRVTTMLTHNSGEWVKSTLSLPAMKADAQGIGGALTYGRRYGLAAMVGIAQEDDDGTAATQKGPPPPPDPVVAMKEHLVASLASIGVSSKEARAEWVRDNLGLDSSAPAWLDENSYAKAMKILGSKKK